MFGPVNRFQYVQQLENQLSDFQDAKNRLVLIDKLVDHYIFTNVIRCKTLLEEQESILETVDFPESRLNFYWNKALFENQMYHYETAERYFGMAIPLLEEQREAQRMIDLCIDYSGTCLNLHDRDKASLLLEKAKKQLKTFPDNRLEARAICREGYIKLHLKDFSQAVKLFLEAEKTMTSGFDPLSLKDYYFLTIIHSGLGAIYEQNDDQEKSVKAYLRAVEMSENHGIRGRLSWHYLNVGKGYMALNDNSSAEEYFLKAIDIRDDISQLARANAYANLGYCYYEKKMYDKALELFDRAESLFDERPEDNFANYSIIEFWRGRLYDEINEQDKAVEHLFEAYGYAKNGEDYRQLAEITKFIADLHAERKDFEGAYNYQTLYDQYSEMHLYAVENRRQRELEVKYDAEKKQREAELLRLQANQLQLKALRAQMNPHFMYNALNAIQDYVGSNEKEKATKYLAKFAHLMRRSLEFSELESIELEKEIEFVDEYLSINEKLRFEDKFSYKITVADDIEEDLLRVPTMIIQPYVENAIEHGLRSIDNGFVKIDFTLLDEDTILCVIEDNGIGRDKARERNEKDIRYRHHRSRGTFITETRLKLLNDSKENQVFVNTVDLKDDDGNALGTRVEVQIPVVGVRMS
jgi:two-component system LytT family sensor kinase